MMGVSYGVRCSFQRTPAGSKRRRSRIVSRAKNRLRLLTFRLLLFAGFLLLRLWLKQRGVFAVPFFLQFFHRNEAQCSRVHAETLTSRRRAIIEQVAEMRIARFCTN